MKRYRYIDDTDDRETIPHGCGVKVRMEMLDAEQRAVTDHFATPVHDALARRNANVGHFPGPVLDILRFGKTTVDRVAVSDALKAATGVSLDEAVALRAKNFADLERRSRNAWKDAKPPADDPDNDEDDPDDDDRSDADNQDAAIARRDLALADRQYKGDRAWRGGK